RTNCDAYGRPGKAPPRPVALQVHASQVNRRVTSRSAKPLARPVEIAHIPVPHRLIYVQII
ncbi:MAG: hypothetical protein ACREFP_06410, partial [Acetobacteraceae bacterium]